MTPYTFFEVTAPLMMAAIFARRREVAVVSARIAPFVALADIAVETAIVDRKRVLAVLTIGIAGDLVADDATQNHAADGRCSFAAAVTELIADHATGDCTEDGTAGAVLTAAIIAIVISAARRRAWG